MTEQPGRENTQQQVPIYLSGPMPRGNTWCATCVLFYMGTMSADTTVQEQVKKEHQDAIAEGASMLVIELPERDELQLQPAITVAPSQYFDAPMPVCWSHVKGYKFAPGLMGGAQQAQPQQQSSLIPGKAHRMREKRDELRTENTPES